MKHLRFEIERAHDDDSSLESLVAGALGVREHEVRDARCARRALDARNKRKKPTWIITVEAIIDGSIDDKTRRKRNVRDAPEEPRILASPRASKEMPPVLVVGAGPAGLFAALHLAENGARVRLLERGKPVDDRARDIGAFRSQGVLNPDSNLCFGEGGAGTYSDGKLTTRKNTPLVREVLLRLVDFGAPESILVDAKPHIGSNKLFRLLRRFRERLLELGVEILFETRMERLRQKEGSIAGIEIHPGGQLDAEQVVLAIGHSARDTWQTLHEQGVPMIAKDFAVGVRAEHPQALIDRAQYNLRVRPETLPPADYRLTHTANGRGVYSFCMCPGGMVVPTATEPETVVVNGMSTSRRGSKYANSGIVAQVTMADLSAEGFAGPLAGIEFQRALEQRAFVAGGSTYRAPAMRATDFIKNRASGELAASKFRPGLTAADLQDLLPAFLCDSLRAGLSRWGGQLKGFVSAEANLIAVESRTSSPLRVPRDKESFQVEGIAGLYVAGEGPGHAGGIVSSAIDGLRVAHALLCAQT